MLTYEQYYNLCKEKYYTNSKTDLYRFTYKIVNEFLENEDYNKIIENISCFLDEQYSTKRNTEESSDTPILKFKDPWNIPEIEKLANIIIPKIEKDVYGCYASVHGLYVYRTKPGDYKKDSSWLWHIDNHPKEILKCIVYLNEVDDLNGPFCILKDDMNRGYKHPTLRIDKDRWKKHHSRFSEQQINFILEQGYQKHNIIGKKGTSIIFDNNIVHRATLCENKPRDVIVFMMKPNIEKTKSVICETHTGSFNCLDVYKDPEFLGIVKI